MTTISCDYLVVGAGASSMAFVDALIARADVDVVVVDRRARPGGQWNDAYPFVRLHQPSASYGVGSRSLGSDTVDADGPNAGFYECASGLEICEHFDQAMDQTLVGSGRVRFYPMSDYVGDLNEDHGFLSRLTGATTRVVVRRRVVDGTYCESSVPATHRPSFDVDPDASVVPVGGLTTVASAPTGYTILGGGKTSMDACNWLLSNGVDPDRIRWIRPRDAWLIDRSSVQPLDQLGSTIEGFSMSVEILAHAESLEGLFDDLQSAGQIHRLDGTVRPTMFRGAILTQLEREALRQIERVERAGRVVRIGTRRIELNGGEVTTSRGELHVDCTARGLGSAPPRPVFDGCRITIQSMTGGFTTYNAALIGVVEATARDDVEKNRLCPPLAAPNVPRDWVLFYRSTMATTTLHGAEEDLAAFGEESRLSLTRGMSTRFDDPQVAAGVERWLTHADAAMANAEHLLTEAARAGATSGF